MSPDASEQPPLRSSWPDLLPMNLQEDDETDPTPTTQPEAESHGPWTLKK